MNKKAKVIILPILLLVIGSIILYIINRPLELEVLTVKNDTVNEYFTEDGEITAGTDVSIIPLVQGELVSVNVVEGQEVKKGDIICTIDSKDYSYSIAQAESVIDGYIAQKSNLDIENQKAKVELEANKKALENEYKNITEQKDISDTTNEDKIDLQELLIEQNKLELTNAQTNADKAKTLYDVGAISKSDYDKATTNLKNAKTALASSQKQLEILKNNNGASSENYIENTKKTVEVKLKANNEYLANDYTVAMQQYYDSLIDAQNTNIDMLKDKIEDCSIKSNVDGVVKELYVTKTNVVAPNSPVAVISTDESVKIETYVDTKYYNNIKVGNQVLLVQEQNSGDIEVKGEVISVDNEAETKISSLGVDEKKIKVCIIPNEKTEINLLDGFPVDVKFLTYHDENKITVPKTAVFKDSDTNKDMVWVIEKNKARLREVVLGQELQSEYVVVSGLEENELVVKSADIEELKSGKRVKVVNIN